MLSKKLILLSLTGVAVLAGCSPKPVTTTQSDETRETSLEQTAPANDSMMQTDKEASPTAETTTMTATEGEELVIDMTNFKFSMPEIKAKAGTTLTVKLTNSQGFHDFVIDDLDVKSKQIKEGEETQVTIVIPANVKGESFEYYCSVGKHKEMGMKGMLIVE